MIQRKQSIWLLLAALITSLMYFLPFGINQLTIEGSTSITENSLNGKSDTILAILIALASAFSLVLVFLFKNRKMQMNLVMVNILVTLMAGGYALSIALQAEKGNKIAVGLVGSQLYIGILLPLVSALLLIMAYNGIKQDEKLVRSTDRLR
jgi:uncharacterized membrane protein YidH (DUF202 family)